MNSVRTAFTARFRQALAEAGYGDAQLRELGELFGVTGQAVRKWLHEEALPSSTRAGELARKLGVRRAWLLDGEMPMRAVKMDIADHGENYATRHAPDHASNNAMGSTGDLSLSAEEFRLLSHYRSLPKNLQEAVKSLLESISRGLRK